MGQEGFEAHSEDRFTSQSMQKQFLCHKNAQNTPIFSVSYSSAVPRIRVRVHIKCLQVEEKRKHCEKYRIFLRTFRNIIFVNFP